MSDDHHAHSGAISRSSCFYHVIDSRLNHVFRFGIQSTCRFVEEKNLWFSYESSSNGNSLFLATAQLYTPFSNLCLILQGHLANEIVTIGKPCHPFDFFLRRLSIGALQPVHDIALDRTSKQGRFLLDNRNVVAQPPRRILVDFHVVQHHLARRLRVQVLHQRNDAAFASTRWPNQRHDRSGGNRQRHAVQDALAGTSRIVHLDVPERDLPPALARLQAALSHPLDDARFPRVVAAAATSSSTTTRRSQCLRHDLSLAVHQFKDLIRGPDCLRQRGEDVSDRAKGVAETLQVQQETHQFTAREMPVPNQQSPVKHNERRHELREARRDGRIPAVGNRLLEGEFEVPVHVPGEFLVLGGCRIKGPDGRHARQGRLGHAVSLRQLGLHDLGQAADEGSVPPGEDGDHRNADKG
mmetsp:Transcript_23973/g.56518  ORF Transcript_23973/g.56518 Transcript_23973/m.56518 type:complete len:411 (-) Transcript_23973:608-1840(-)